MSIEDICTYCQQPFTRIGYDGTGNQYHESVHDSYRCEVAQLRAQLERGRGVARPVDLAGTRWW